MAFDIASLKYDILNGIRHVYELKGKNGSIAKIILRYNQNEFSFNVDYVELKKDFTMEDKEEIKILIIIPLIFSLGLIGCTGNDESNKQEKETIKLKKKN